MDFNTSVHYKTEDCYAKEYRKYSNTQKRTKGFSVFLFSKVAHHNPPCKNLVFIPGSIIIFLGKGQESTVRIWLIRCNSNMTTSVAAVKLPVTTEQQRHKSS
jgi:hypothetical protein